MTESSSQKVKYDFRVKLLLFGDDIGGKTSFATRFVDNEFDPRSYATISPVVYFKNLTVDKKIVHCEIWDLPGTKVQRRFFPMYCKDSDGGLAIFDLGDRDAFGEIGAFIKEFRQWTVQDQPTVLVGNKSDLVTERKVTSVEGMDLAKQLNIPYMETSAFNAINVEEAFIILIKNILKKKENMLKAFTNLSLKEINSTYEAQTIGEKVFCVKCDNETCLFTCQGCLDNFCHDHATIHQQTLAEKMDGIKLDCDRFYQMIIDEPPTFGHHSLLKQINEWETQSITTIRHAADSARNEVMNIAHQNRANLTVKLRGLTRKMDQVRQECDFSEIELREWRKQLDRVNDEMFFLNKIKIQQIFDRNSFIPKISVQSIPYYRFEQSTGGIRIDENGLVIVQGLSNIPGTAQGGDGLSSGKHRIRFHLETFHPDKWTFFGIVSTYNPLQPVSVNTPAAYGWNGFNGDFNNGEIHSHFLHFRKDFKMNDHIELEIDCKKKIIRLINHRTNRIREQLIDINQCPLPWHFRVCLVSQDDRIRLEH